MVNLASKSKAFSKEEFSQKLKEISQRGWIVGTRQGNNGNVGNTLEDLLGIKENNLPIADIENWELKAQRKNTGSYGTLFHMEPEPRSARFVPALLLPKYGWKHQTIENEMSFRATLNGATYTDRGLKVVVNRIQKKVFISFNSAKSDPRHAGWLQQVKKNVGLGEINPQPYWAFESLEKKVVAKLKNVFYVIAEYRFVEKIEQFKYSEAWILENFSFQKFLKGIEGGDVLIDFDARTGHNHGTKFRVYEKSLPKFYAKAIHLF